MTSFLLLVLCWTSLTGPLLSAGKGRIFTVLGTKVAYFSLTSLLVGSVFTACVVYFFFSALSHDSSLPTIGRDKVSAFSHQENNKLRLFLQAAGKQPNPLCCNRSTTNFIISSLQNTSPSLFLSELMDLFSFNFRHWLFFVSPANCHQPETRAVGHPCNPMDLFVLGRDESAADQPNNLAEGHPSL